MRNLKEYKQTHNNKMDMTTKVEPVFGEFKQLGGF